MKIKLLFALFSLTTISNAQTQIGQEIVANSGEELGYAVKLSENGNVMTLTGVYQNGQAFVRSFANINGTWAQMGQDIVDPDPTNFGRQRIDISNDGLRIVTNHVSGGEVMVFEFKNNSWIQLGQNLAPDVTSGGFAHDVQISGDGNTVITGNPGSSPYLHVFRFVNGNWITIGKIAALSSDYFGPYFGHAVAISDNGDTVAASDFEYFTAGATAVYKYVNNTFQLLGSIITTNAGNEFAGWRIALSGDGTTLITHGNGAQNGDTGAARIYKFNGTDWSQIGNTLFGINPYDRFGIKVDINKTGNVILVGSRDATTANGNCTGKVEIFENIQGTWTKKGLSILGDNPYDRIGDALSLSNDGKQIAVTNYKNGNYSWKQNLNNQQQKGGTPSSIKVFNIEGILNNSNFVLENFEIYPNPTSDILNIELKENIILEKVNIFDTTGKLVKETTEKTINLSGFSKGVYTVQVLTEKGIATKKVIIN